MLKQLLLVGVIVSTCFLESYSMDRVAAEDEAASSSDIPLTGVPKLVVEQCIGQCYGKLDAQIRACSVVEEIARVFDLVEKYADETGDVCMIYHLCRTAYEAVDFGSHPKSNDLENMQRRFIFILVRVYIDAMACTVIAETAKSTRHCEDIYNLFRSKVKEVWYSQIAEHDAEFSALSEAALGHIQSIITKLPSPIWVYFCHKSSFSYVGILNHTIYFGNVDNRYDYRYKEHTKAIEAAKSAAFEKIKAKLQAIAASEKSNQEKWLEFLNLTYSGI